MSSIIAAVRKEDEFQAALCSGCGIIFDLSPDILTLKERVNAAHGNNKKLYIHIDLAGGIGKDKSGIAFAKSVGVDGIISTRVNIIKLARELKMHTVQRFFIVDSHSVDTTVDAIAASRADMIEVMPGIAGKAIKKLRETVSTPIIAGGLIETAEELKAATESGASAVSTGSRMLWEMEI